MGPKNDNFDAGLRRLVVGERSIATAQRGRYTRPNAVSREEVDSTRVGSRCDQR